MTTKITTLRTLYVHVALNIVRCFPQILYYIVLYAPQLIPVKFFPKYYLQFIINKLCFELPQNVTWTDE